MVRKFDFLVIGSGVAGMSYALKVANAGKGRVALVCKTSLEEANTTKAQGGCAPSGRMVATSSKEILFCTSFSPDSAVI